MSNVIQPTTQPTTQPAVTRSRSFCFTWNNPTAQSEDTIRSLEAQYFIFGKETAPTTGTPHLQGYLHFSNARTVRSLIRKLPGVHVSIARGTYEQNRAYCAKEGVVVESGIAPANPHSMGSEERLRWDSAWAHAKLGEIEAIPADIRIRCYSTLQRIARDYMPAVQPLDGVCGLWIHGASGCGKTRSVLSSFPECYIKPRNMWWCGYQSESVVLLDDVDIYDVKLGGALKHWADFSPFIAEVKGGGFRIRPSKFIVTSQYTIEQIWTDQPTRDALNRRFKSVEKTPGQTIIF